MHLDNKLLKQLLKARRREMGQMLVVLVMEQQLDQNRRCMVRVRSWERLL